ncbi:hypothetical protein D3C71_2146080 [compost metagenome]
MGLDQKFGAMGGQAEIEALERRSGHGAEQGIDIGGANDAEHFGAFVIGMGEVAHDASYFVRSA